MSPQEKKIVYDRITIARAIQESFLVLDRRASDGNLTQ